jgi:hypothetical protein
MGLVDAANRGLGDVAQRDLATELDEGSTRGDAEDEHRLRLGGDGTPAATAAAARRIVATPL